MKSVYISSFAFSNREIDAILRTCQAKGIGNLELGSSVAFDRDIRKKIIKAAKSMKLLLHNYFPAPERPFVLNLASPDKDSLKRSKNLVLKAVEISSEIEASIFSFHAGFSYVAEAQLLGKEKQKHLKRFPIGEAEKIFENSVFELSAKAELRGVKLLVENNVILSSSLDRGINKTCLMADISNSLFFLKRFKEIGVGLLLDTGHLQVSAKVLGFNKNDFVRDCSKYVGALHVSENNLELDQNLPIGKNSWAIEVIKEFSDKPITVEVGQNIDAAISSANLINILN